MGRFLTALGRRLKPIERANKVAWRAVHRLLWRNRPLGQRLQPSAARRVLFLRYDAVGDMLTTLPAIALLKRHAPSAAIDVVASPRNRAVIEGDPNVERIIEMRDGFFGMLAAVRRARARRYDAIICCIFGRGTKVGIIANLIGGRRAVKSTIWREAAYWTYFNVQSRAAGELRSMFERTAHVVTDTFAIDREPNDLHPYVALPASTIAAARARAESVGLESGAFLLVNLSVSYDRNRWGEENFAAYVASVRDRVPTLRVGLMALPADRPLAERIAALNDHVAVLPPVSDVRDAIATVAQAAAVFTPDTGVIHMASATGRPVVALYASLAAATDWAPYGVPCRTLVGDGATLATVDVAQAVAATMDLLAEAGIAAQAP